MGLLSGKTVKVNEKLLDKKITAALNEMNLAGRTQEIQHPKLFTYAMTEITSSGVDTEESYTVTEDFILTGISISMSVISNPGVSANYGYVYLYRGTTLGYDLGQIACHASTSGSTSSNLFIQIPNLKVIKNDILKIANNTSAGTDLSSLSVVFYGYKE